MIPTTEDFRVALQTRMQEAQRTSKTTVEINSGQLHREVSGYPSLNHRMPTCCAAMKSEMRAGDAAASLSAGAIDSLAEEESAASNSTRVHVGQCLSIN
jgi:hypothetical protein